jgi:hypothetical protein
MLTEGWTHSKGLEVLLACRAFLFFKKYLRTGTPQNSPHLFLLTKCAINMYWITRIISRIADCELLFGHVIWHNPDGGLDVETRGERIKTNIIVLRIQYPSGYDEEIRNFGVTQGEMAERARRMPETGEASRPLLTVAGASQSGADSADGAVSCDGNEELVTITVVYLTGECVDFKLKRDVPMRNVFKAFTQPRTLKFPHNGKFIGGDEHRIR